jgi:hypothetical protein
MESIAKSKKLNFLREVCIKFSQAFTLCVLLEAFVFGKIVDQELLIQSIGFSVLISIVITILAKVEHEMSINE